MKLKIFKYHIIVQKLEMEYMILITPYENQEGLESLVTDKAKLINYISRKGIRPKRFTQECEIKFKQKE